MTDLAPNEPESSRKLFLGGLNHSTTEDGLRNHFEKYGKLVDVIVMRFPGTKRSRGFGFITYSTASEADTVFEKQPHTIDNATIEAKRATPQKEMNKTNALNEPVSSCKLSLGGLDYSTTEDGLRNHFEKYGKLVDVVVKRFLGTKQSRGFGFITYSTAAEADAAFAGRPHTIDTATIETKWARPRKQTNKARGGGSKETHIKLSTTSTTDVTNISEIKIDKPMEINAKTVATTVKVTPAGNLGGCMDFDTALREVLKSAYIENGVALGLSQTIKALDNDQILFQPLFCILAENCDNAVYKNLIQALCHKRQIPILIAPDWMQLGKYAGLCKLDAKGKMRVVKCSSIVVCDWGKEGPAHDFIREHFKQQFDSSIRNICRPASAQWSLSCRGGPMGVFGPAGVEWLSGVRPGL